MSDNGISIIFLPTLNCNAACEYCFEEKSTETMSIDRFRLMLVRILRYLRDQSVENLKIYWQGGEILTMSPNWFEQAYDIMMEESEHYGINLSNELQTNLIGYSADWNGIIEKVFGNQLGSSLDYPNLHRKTLGGRPQEFNSLWVSKYRQAREAGINVGIISIPNAETMKLGARSFYNYFIREIGLTGFQVNSPFPGGPAGNRAQTFQLQVQAYGRFCVDLIDIWLNEGYAYGIGISPYDGILEYFRSGDLSRLLCGMQPDCSRSFFSIDPKGNVSQCDCWVTSYPDYWFGNIFDVVDFRVIMESSNRKKFSERPIEIIQTQDCISCSYLSICHGGCAIRAYSATGCFSSKDPYCEAYKMIYERLQRASLEPPLSLNNAIQPCSAAKN